MKVQMTAKYETPDHSPLTASEIGAFSIFISSQAQNSAIPVQSIQRDVGSQFDPEYLTVGLRADWEVEA